MIHQIETNLDFNDEMCNSVAQLVFRMFRDDKEAHCIFGYEGRQGTNSLVVKFECNGAVLRSVLFEMDKKGWLD